MPTWLDMVKMEIGCMESKGIMVPTHDVDKKTDHIVGVVEPEIQKLYGLAMQWKKAAMEMGISASFDSDDSSRKQTFEKFQQLDQKSGLLMEIFWVSLKDTFELWDKPSVGIRKGWKVVWSDNDIPPIIDIFNDLFGRGR